MIGGGLLRQFPAAGAGGFPIDAWIEATTSGQPSLTATGTNITTALALTQLISIDNDRWLALYYDSSSYLNAQIFSKSGGTGSVGTAQVVLSSAVTLTFVKRVPNTNSVIIGLNNDLYLLACGASGTTLTVTQISTDAGDAGRGEAFVLNVTDLLFASDNSHMVITNEFNNGGTRSFVSALYTLNLGTPSATYVTRDVDATGSAAALECGIALATTTAGSGVFFGVNWTDTTSLRVTKITFTSSTVSNSTSTLTLGATVTDPGGSYITRMLSTIQDNLARLVLYRSSGNGVLSSLVDVSGAPSYLADNVSNSIDNLGITTIAFTLATYKPSDPALRRICRLSDNAAGTGYFLNSISGDMAFATRDLITGLTTPAIRAAQFSPDGNWIAAVGKTSTNTGQFFLFKNTNA